MSALTDVFTAIANAIRGKNGLSTTYKPNQMAQAITDIPSGASLDAIGYMSGSATLIKDTDDGIKVLIFPNPFPVPNAQIHSLVYNNESNRDEFLIGFQTTIQPYPIYRIKSDDTLEAISISGFANRGCSRLRKLDMGSYTSYPKFYFLANGSTDVQNKIVKSVDGVTWSTETITFSSSAPSSIIYNDIAFSPQSNMYVAISYNITTGRVIYRKGTQSTWTLISLSMQFQVNSVAYGHGRFVIVGTTGRIVYSNSGTSAPTSWTPVNNSSFSTVSFQYVDWVEELSSFVCMCGNTSTVVFLEVTSNGTVKAPIVMNITGLKYAYQAIYNPRTEKVEMLGLATTVGTYQHNVIVEFTGEVASLNYTIKSLGVSNVATSVAYKPIS